MTKQSENKSIPELRFPEFKDDGKWEEKKLGAIGETLMCKRILKEQTTSYSKDGIPFYKIGTFGKEADSFIPFELYEEFKNKYSFPKVGDILISASGTIGRLVVYDGSPAYFQDSNIIWLGNKEDQILNSFLYHCYSTLKWQTSDGGVISRLYNSDLKNMRIKYPRLKSEQQKIANCLSSLDEVITANTAKLEVLKEHKKGLMQTLFPQEGENAPKYRFKEFENDGNWAKKTIGEFAPLQRGFDLPVDNIVPGDYPVAFSNGILKYHNKFKAKAPGVVTGRSGTIGKVTYVNENFWPHNTALWVTDFCGNYPLFVFYYFYVVGFEQFGTGSGVPTLNRNDVHRHSILVPKFKEQQKIAETLSSLDRLITAQSEKIEQLKIHKKGLMQKLFPAINE